MRFDVVTLFPDVLLSLRHAGLIGQAIEKGLIQLHLHNPRQFATDSYKSVDDRPFGGADGMIMLAEPLAQTIELVSHECERQHIAQGPVIYLSPAGEKLTHSVCEKLHTFPQLTLVCGRYGGVDQRFIQKYVDLEISIGDYIVNGGELPAMVLIDSVSRLIPGVLGNQVSLREESFFSGLLEAPQFTRPREFAGLMVPDVLLSGNHAKIQKWTRLVSILLTEERRPDLLEKVPISSEELHEAHELEKTMTSAEREACGLKADS